MNAVEFCSDAWKIDSVGGVRVAPRLELELPYGVVYQEIFAAMERLEGAGLISPESLPPKNSSIATGLHPYERLTYRNLG